MTYLEFEQKTPYEVTRDVAQAMRARRKERGFSQAELAQRAGVSLGSLKRFERTHEIALASLVRLALALGCEEDFERLFAHRQYRSIQEVIDAQK
ncbi:MAG: helix-turn-helix transcriptional regulator [Coriobacteriales bacterium]|jgi:transcriptional regulator with XRE-family HTH domain|nr:helix-turn-helix transcriptional regulator [Coriobacteriales bacterium]